VIRHGTFAETNGNGRDAPKADLSLAAFSAPRMTPKPSFRRPASHAHRDVTSLLGSALTENRVICQFREMVEAGCLASSGISLTTPVLLVDLTEKDRATASFKGCSP
jgi:hypothetical protein